MPRLDAEAPRFDAEAIAFGIAWAGLALYAGMVSGWQVGAALSVGLMVMNMPHSIFVLTRTDNFRTERIVRWSLLVLAAALYLVWVSR